VKQGRLPITIDMLCEYLIHTLQSITMIKLGFRVHYICRHWQPSCFTTLNLFFLYNVIMGGKLAHKEVRHVIILFGHISQQLPKWHTFFSYVQPVHSVYNMRYISNPKQSSCKKKVCCPEEGHCEIQGGGQGIAVMVG